MKSLIFALSLSLIATSGAFAQALDPDLQPYKRVSGVAGSISSIGSDTLNNLMTLWLEGFRAQYPGVKTQVEGKGSATAPAALISGTAQLGPMSRKMKSEEIETFEKAFGYPPLAVPVAIDGLAVYVHRDNPIQQLTMQQVDAIFSKTRRGGAAKSIDTWGELGLTGSWANLRMSTFGRNSASGTYGFFKEKALFKGDFKDSVKEQPGSASVAQGIAENIAGIGYSGMGYKTSEIRGIALAKSDKDPFYEPSNENVLSGKYPLARYLYVYINKAPGRPLDPAVSEFLRYVMSREGQEVVVKDGYLPLPAKVVTKALLDL
jgi:phosphate transport system substrate-binding protein